MSTTTKALAGFIIGASIGVAVGYFLNSDDKEEVIDTLKDTVRDLKDKLVKGRNHVEESIEDAIAG